MPNWVENWVTVAGDKETLDAFVSKMSTPISGRQRNYEAGKGVWEEVGPIETAFSYHNILPVPTNILDQYYTDADGTEGPNNWYNWNCRVWGVKWDCAEASVERESDEKVAIQFQSPWSAPVGIFEALVQQYPTLHFEFHYEEEQGWGGVFESKDGELVSVREWDIPESHAENAAIDRPCVCEYEEEAEYWFDDCPGKGAAAEDSISFFEDADEMASA